MKRPLIPSITPLVQAAAIVAGLAIPGIAWESDATTNTLGHTHVPWPTIVTNHPHMQALIENAFLYIRPGQGTIDAASGYPVEGWNQDPQQGHYLRSFTQLTAIGTWTELLANIAAGQAENPYISPEHALVELARVLRSLRRDQHDPQVSASGLLGNFLGFEGNRRNGPLAREVAKQDFLNVFGTQKGAAIWQALTEKRWIAPENHDREGVVLRGDHYGCAGFTGPLAPFADDATRRQVMELLDRRIVTVAYGDNANLSASLASASGALLRPSLRGNRAAAEIRKEIELFLEDQRAGYQFLFDDRTGLFRFGWNASSGRYFGWEDAGGKWKVGHSDYLVNEFRGPTMFVVLRYGLPHSAIGNLGMKIKPYRMADGRVLYALAPWEGSAFQALGLSLFMGEMRHPSWRLILRNLVDIELDFSKRHSLPGFLSESYTGYNSQYTGAIGIPEITVSPTPRITDVASLYPLGVAYAISSDGVERMLKERWDKVSRMLSDHGPWEGFNVTTGKVVRFQTTAHVLSLILGCLDTASENMARYLESRSLGPSLASFYQPGKPLDLLGQETKAIAWTPDRSKVLATRDTKNLRLHGNNVGQAGLTFVLPNPNGESLSGGILRIRYRLQHPIERAVIRLDKKEFALEEAGVIPNEIFLDSASLLATDDQERTIEIPLPAIPVLRGIRELALFFGSVENRGPIDVLFTAFEFVPFSPGH